MPPPAHQLLLNERDQEAISAARRALRVGSDPASCLLIVALAKQRLGDSEAAREAYRVASHHISAHPTGDRVRRSLLKRADVVFTGR